MGFKLGLDAKLYYLTTGTRATWPASGAPMNLDEIGNVRDVTLSVSTSEADVTTRGNNGWKAVVAALKDASIDFEMVWDDADTAFTAIKDAFMATPPTPIAFAVLDQSKDTVGAQGLWADCIVSKFDKSEPLEDAQKVAVTIRPTFSAVAPEWAEVGA